MIQNPAIWPYFSLEKDDEELIPGQTVWRASTNTQRHTLPIFSILLSVSSEIPEDEVRRIAAGDLQSRFKAAHPSGCPERKRGR
jgi:hypothetical protein